MCGRSVLAAKEPPVLMKKKPDSKSNRRYKGKLNGL
jgi:hypothetical protein